MLCPSLYATFCFIKNLSLNFSWSYEYLSQSHNRFKDINTSNVYVYLTCFLLYILYDIKIVTAEDIHRPTMDFLSFTNHPSHKTPRYSAPHTQARTHHVILSEVNGGADGLLSFSRTQKSALGAGRGTWQLLVCCQDRLVWHDSIRRSARQTGSGEFCRMPYEIPIALGYTHTNTHTPISTSSSWNQTINIYFNL